jgi:hypothetical protein
MRRILFLLFVASGIAGAKEVSTGVYALSSQLLPNILAKEICSCLYVSKTAQRLGKKEALRRCLARANLPLSPILLRQLLVFDLSLTGRVIVNPTPAAEVFTGTKVSSAAAIFDFSKPQYGCTIIQTTH